MGEADTVGEHNNERKGEFPFPNTEESEKKIYAFNKFFTFASETIAASSEELDGEIEYQLSSQPKGKSFHPFCPHCIH